MIGHAVSCPPLHREGEAGDNLYVIQAGVYEAIKGAGAGEKVLFRYEDKGAFGELALMYNCPRAATVRVSLNTPGTLSRCCFDEQGHVGSLYDATCAP